MCTNTWSSGGCLVSHRTIAQEILHYLFVPSTAMSCKDYTILLSFRSLTGLFAEASDLLSFPLGCPFSRLHVLAEPLRMHPAVVTCSCNITASAQGQEPSRTSPDGQTPTFAFGEPQVSLPANMSLLGTSCVTTKRPDTELWSCGLQPLLFP